jgi:hypothetical protein
MQPLTKSNFEFLFSPKVIWTYTVNRGNTE